MDAIIRETLRNGGIDVDALLERCMGNEALLCRLLKKFPSDISYARLVEASQKGDEDSLREASHTLKGVCGNLSITSLFDLLDRQLRAIRAGDMQSAEAIMPDIASKYEQAIQAIEQGLA